MHDFVNSLRRLALVALLWPFCLLAQPASAPVAKGPVLAGSGASFPSQIYQQWSARYAQARGVEVVYKPTGSGDGVRQISERKVALAGTDSPLSAAELTKRKLLQVPTVVGAVVPVVNLAAGVDRPLQLSGEVLADLFLGRIARWNDPRVQALNPGLSLPDLPVQRIVRADKSGTTEAFSRYLALMSTDFAREVGEGQLPRWTGQVHAADGNGGVVKKLNTTPGGITYTSLDRAFKDKLATVRLKNAAGQWVQASEASLVEALRASDVHRRGEDTASTLNMPGAGSWPISVVTFLLFDATPQAGDERTLQALRFLYWAFQQGDRLVQGTGFVPLPVALQARLAGRLATVRTADGQPLVLY